MRGTTKRGARTTPTGRSKTGTALDCASLHLRGARLRARTAAQVKRAGYQLAAFTVNDRKRACRLVGFGVDCIITDRPDVIAAALG